MARAAAAAAAVDRAATDKVVEIVVKARVLDQPQAPRQRPVRRRSPRNRVRLPAARRIDARVVISQPARIRSDGAAEAVISQPARIRSDGAAEAAIRLTVGINSDGAVRAARKVASRVAMERTAEADSDEAVGAEAEEVAIRRPCSIVSRTCRRPSRSSSSIG